MFFLEGFKYGVFFRILLVCLKMLFVTHLLLLIVLSGASNVTEYLLRYGYLTTNNTNLQSEKEALRVFQSYYHLPGDGELNKETLELMNTPRCGVPDNIVDYKVHSEFWRKRVITWNITPSKYVATGIKVFDTWSKHANLVFHRETRYRPDITITFPNSDSNNTHYNDMGLPCGSKFGSTALAHAFYPNADGSSVEIHVNMAYAWGGGPNAEELYGVLVHEVGHSLGIEHSDKEDAIMYPYYKDNITGLHSDDIEAIQHLYGPPRTTTTKPTTRITTTPRTTPRQTSTTETTTQPIQTSEMPEDLRTTDICDRPASELKFLVIDTNLYIFHKANLWIMDLKTKKFTSQSIYINGLLRFLPKFTDITAIYQRSNKEIVAIINNMIFVINYPQFTLNRRYNITHFDETFPDRIMGIVNTNRGLTYIFFRENYYTVLDECTFQTKGIGYISKDFLGVPGEFNSVFRFTNGRLYFFQGDRYFEFDEFENVLQKSAKTSLSVFGIDCPAMSLYEQLKFLLQKILKNNRL